MNRSWYPYWKMWCLSWPASDNLTAEAIPLLEKVGANVTRLSSLAEEITKAEERADGLHDAGLREHFQRCGNTDAMGWIVGSELYGQLEKRLAEIPEAPTRAHVPACVMGS
jgi:uncharacterized protein Yka (UPF0111/DUF47 family)